MLQNSTLNQMNKLNKCIYIYKHKLNCVKDFGLLQWLMVQALTRYVWMSRYRVYWCFHVCLLQFSQLCNHGSTWTVEHLNLNFKCILKLWFNIGAFSTDSHTLLCFWYYMLGNGCLTSNHMPYAVAQGSILDISSRLLIMKHMTVYGGQ